MIQFGLQVGRAFVGSGGDAAALDRDGEHIHFERPGVNRVFTRFSARKSQRYGRFAGAGGKAVDSRQAYLAEAEVQAELIGELQQVEIEKDEILFRGAAQYGQAVAKGLVGGEADGAAEVFLDFDLLVLEFDQAEFLGRGVDDRSHR